MADCAADQALQLLHWAPLTATPTPVRPIPLQVRFAAKLPPGISVLRTPQTHQGRLAFKISNRGTRTLENIAIEVTYTDADSTPVASDRHRHDDLLFPGDDREIVLRVPKQKGIRAAHVTVDASPDWYSERRAIFGACVLVIALLYRLMF